MTREDLKTMQSWSLQRKIQVTQTRIIEWYQHYEGKVYVSFSGGKDSTVLLDLARRVYPNIEAVFMDTGLEYPEIRQFVKTKENVTVLRPKMQFGEVIKKYGYPLISKDVSKIIYGARHSEKKKQNYFNRLDGLNPDFSESEYKQQYKKWKFLLDAPFEVSNRCCYWLKEKPLKNYTAQTGNKPIVATMTDDSNQRKSGWFKTGCNAFDSDRPISKPMSFWTEQDVLTYIKQTDSIYCSVYGDIVASDGECDYENTFFELKLHCTGCQRTGCMFCMFGVHLEKEPNRFQRMKITHPKQYDYCINQLGLGEVLDYIGVKY